MSMVSPKQTTSSSTSANLTDALWRIYRRPERPELWTQGGNLPWNEPAFSARMLREHLDESHSAASRQTPARAAQLDWLWAKLALQPGASVLDFTCGPGLYAVPLAERGCLVQGIDFGPASIAYARAAAAAHGVAQTCTFVEQDVRQSVLPLGAYDAALFLYGQVAVFRREEAVDLLAKLAAALKPGGRLCIELLDQEQVDKKSSNWWYTDATGLWGDAPFLHLGERWWDAKQQLSQERFLVLHLETGQLDEVHLCDQTYAAAEMVDLLQQVGFAQVDTYAAWDGLPLPDAREWVVYVATR